MTTENPWGGSLQRFEQGAGADEAEDAIGGGGVREKRGEGGGV